MRACFILFKNCYNKRMEENIIKPTSVGKSAPHLSVIIPAYNEETRISKTLLEIDKYLSKQTYKSEIIVVNDGSTDGTARVVEKFKNLIANLRFENNRENHGKGYVVRQGMLAARGDVRLFTDADNSTSIEHIEKMWQHFSEGADVVIGSRDSKDAAGASQAVQQPFLKRLLGNMANMLIQIVAVWGIWDTQNGFKAFTAKAAQDIFSRARINRWGFDIEALALARELKYRIAIIPVHWINDPATHVTLKGYINTFVELFKVRVNLWRDVYSVGKSVSQIKKSSSQPTTKAKLSVAKDSAKSGLFSELSKAKNQPIVKALEMKNDDSVNKSNVTKTNKKGSKS